MKNRFFYGRQNKNDTRQKFFSNKKATEKKLFNFEFSFSEQNFQKLYFVLSFFQEFPGLS